jgi:probable HAF family extracellular repeat protein
MGVNDLGQIVGSSFQTGNSIEHAVVYHAGTVTDLGALSGILSAANGINNAGVVVGYSLLDTYTNGNANAAAFMYAPGGNMIDIGTLGGLSAAAERINDAGQIVGVSTLSAASATGGSAAQHGFLWVDGLMRDLGTLGGNSSIAWGINNGGQIVGVAETASGDDHAFLYECGMMIDLNSLLPEASGWQLYEARAINDSGRIVGWGFSPSGGVHAFLLALEEEAVPRKGLRGSARVACLR